VLYRLLAVLLVVLQLDHAPVAKHIARAARRRQRAAARTRYLHFRTHGFAPTRAAKLAGLPVIGGGADEPDPVAVLFPDLEDVDTLSVEQLAELEERLVDTFRRVRDLDEEDEQTKDLTTEQVIKALERGAEQIEEVRAAKKTQEEAAEAVREQIEQISARVDGEAGEGDPPPEGGEGDSSAEGDGEGDGEGDAQPAPEGAVVAGGRTRARDFIPRRADRNRPNHTDDATGASMVLLTEVPGVGHQGDTLTSMEQLSAAFRHRFDRLRSARGAHGGERFPVVSLRWSPPQHTISERASEQEATSLIASALREQLRNPDGSAVRAPLLAHGGICIPQQVNYDLPAPLNTAERPVRDALPRVGVDRGGLTFITPPRLSDVPTLAVGDVTSTEDASATAADYTKTFARITCPTASEVLVDAIFWQLEFGVQESRTWPELVDYWTNLTVAAHAVQAETKLLNSLKAGSALLTTTRPSNGVADAATTPNILLGFTPNLIRQLLTLAAGIRSRERMGRDAPLRIMLPDWVPTAYAIDTAMRKPDEPELGSRARFEALLRQLGLQVSYYLDSPTTPAVKFAAQNAGALVAFPASFLAFVYADGVWVYMDGGELDLGVVRDAGLVNTNDYRVFYESFENVAKVGGPSYALTLDTCMNGATAAAVPIEC
jgi:hypothetical protein